MSLSPRFSRGTASKPPSSSPLYLQIQPSSPPMYAQLPSPFQETAFRSVPPKAEPPPDFSTVLFDEMNLNNRPSSPTRRAVLPLGWNEASSRVSLPENSTLELLNGTPDSIKKIAESAPWARTNSPSGETSPPSIPRSSSSRITTPPILTTDCAIASGSKRMVTTPIMDRKCPLPMDVGGTVLV